jgi:hypothetical protein
MFLLRALEHVKGRLTNQRARDCKDREMIPYACRNDRVGQSQSADGFQMVLPLESITARKDLREYVRVPYASITSRELARLPYEGCMSKRVGFASPARGPHCGNEGMTTSIGADE